MQASSIASKSRSSQPSSAEASPSSHPQRITQSLGYASTTSTRKPEPSVSSTTSCAANERDSSISPAVPPASRHTGLQNAVVLHHLRARSLRPIHGHIVTNPLLQPQVRNLQADHILHNLR